MCRTESEYIIFYSIITIISLLIVAVTGFFCIRYIRNKFKSDKGALYASQLYQERADEAS